MQENRPVPGYALNAFACESFEQWWHCLRTDVMALQRRVAPSAVLPVELRWGERLLAELTAERLAQWQRFFASQPLAPVSVNAFVMPAFHGERVKERVYEPAWHDGEARLRFTNACVDRLVALAGPGASVSAPFGALKPVPMAAVAGNIRRAAEHAAERGIVLALEPEPGLCVETADEVIEFFQTHVPVGLRQHLAVTLDLSHQLVQFESLPECVTRWEAAGIRIAKIHISNAAELTEWRPFYEDSIYLHQVSGADAAGRRRYFSLDWPEQPPTDIGIARYRCHYHLPVCPGPWPSTLGEVEAFLRWLADRPLARTAALIIETYTWPQQLRGADRLVDNMARELMWVRKTLGWPEG